MGYVNFQEGMYILNRYKQQERKKTNETVCKSHASLNNINLEDLRYDYIHIIIYVQLKITFIVSTPSKLTK